MLFVISHEIVPESHRKGHERLATTGLMLGFVPMMVLDTALGGAPPKRRSRPAAPDGFVRIGAARLT